MKRFFKSNAEKNTLFVKQHLTVYTLGAGVIEDNLAIPLSIQKILLACLNIVYSLKKKYYKFALVREARSYYQKAGKYFGLGLIMN
jgi:hypothetical protein